MKLTARQAAVLEVALEERVQQTAHIHSEDSPLYEEAAELLDLLRAAREIIFDDGR